MWTIFGDKLGWGNLRHFSLDEERNYYSQRLCTTDPLTHTVTMRARAEFAEMVKTARLDPEGTCPDCLAICGVTRQELSTITKLREL